MMQSDILKDSPLGKNILDDTPELFAIDRSKSRSNLDAQLCSSLAGEDSWRLHELSWLQPNGIPTFHSGEVIIPAQSKNIIESKSLKLYCNSLNQKTFESAAKFCRHVADDISKAIGTNVDLKLYPEHLADNIAPSNSAQSLDEIKIEPSDALEKTAKNIIEQTWKSNLLRSNCPVTAAPDWASVAIRYRGHEINPGALLRLIISLRDSQGFHENCVEKIFCEIWEKAKPEMLHVQAFYTRRGGIDINPWRSLVR
jgi:7-cyano-7-deazaguanine reductase